MRCFGASHGERPRIVSSDDFEPIRLGTFVLEKRLGRGGMGEVFLAWDERLERHVAMKRIVGDKPADDLARTRFRREARAVARLSHPAIVQVFDLFEADGDDCLVMEYVEGCGLEERIAGGDLSVDDALRLGAEIADGLAEAHGKGFVHRDLKPENIRLTPAGRAKILDFGLARLLFREPEGAERSGEESITRSGVLVGTVHAMSPEQAAGHAVDHRSDLFALGSLLYEMLTGRAPFRGRNLLDTLRRIHGETPEPLSDLRPGLAPELVKLVESLLAKDPVQRPQNARLVADALEALRGTSQDAPAERSPAPPGASRPPDADALSDLPTGEWPLPAAGPTPDPETALRTLVRVELAPTEEAPQPLDQGTAFHSRWDRALRDLLAHHGGYEIEKAAGFSLLFAVPSAAVDFALASHLRLAELTADPELTHGVRLRVAVHLGEVRLRHNSPQDVSRGARPFEVEGPARPVVARLLSLVQPGQTLLTSSAFEVARRAADTENRDQSLTWLAHGTYRLPGATDDLEVFEVGVESLSPLIAPPAGDGAHRVVSAADELVLGWRPAPGQTVPRRPNWRLLERLGEGGFGEVWLAEHPSAERRVFKFCFDATRLRALQREVTLFRVLKEALGHREDIARVLDWSFDAPPFFLEAEHTEGGDLVAWAEQQGGLGSVSLATRLELVAQVADALGAAHSVGVLHKDVKPGNVLVTHDVDGQPRIRLTDFGIGDLLDRSRLEEGAVTAQGFTETLPEEAGSARYLAPERMEGRPASIPADLYSLGILLYQVTVGDFGRPLAPGWRRDIPDEVLAGDIATLVDGDPTRRPGSAGAIAAGLRALPTRHQERQDLHRVQQRQRRLRFAAGVGAVVAALALILAFQSTLARQRAEQLEARAVAARGDAEELIAFLLGDLQQNLQAVGRLDALEGAGEKALEYFDTLDAQEVGPQTVARHAKALHQMGDLRMAQGDLEGALGLFEAALAKSQQLVEQSPGDDDALFELGQSHFWVGNLHWQREELDQALEQFDAYLEVSKRVWEKRPEKAGWRLEVAYGHANVGEVMVARGNFGLAFEHLGQAVEHLEEVVALEPLVSYRRELVDARLRLGNLHYLNGRPAEALDQTLVGLGEVRGLVTELPGDAHLKRQQTVLLDLLGYLQLFFGDLQDALETNRSNLEMWHSLVSLEPDNVEWRSLLAIAQGGHGELLGYLGQWGEAERYLDQALATTATADQGPLSALHRSRFLVLSVHQKLALGELSQAVATAQQAVELVRPFLEGGEASAVHRRHWADAQLALGSALTVESEPESAAAFRTARETLRSWPGERSPGDDWRLLKAHLGLGEFDPARPLAYTLLGMGFRHPEFLQVCQMLGIQPPRNPT